MLLMHSLIPKTLPGLSLGMCLAGGEVDYGDGDGYYDEKAAEEVTEQGESLAKGKAAGGAQEDGTPAGAAS